MRTDHLDGSAANSDGWDDPSILPPRRKTGGRKKGTPNKRTAARRAAIAAITASGKDPISFFADLLRNEQAPLDLRFAAAKELAPYTHPKLASIESRTTSLCSCAPPARWPTEADHGALLLKLS
jgi:hypothetical protein